MRVYIKYRAITVDNRFMPEFMYEQKLKVIEEKENTIVVCFHDNEFYKYEFKKKYILERLA